MEADAHAAQDVIIDTDIGTDIDDAYALLLALASPELNIKGLTLVHADLQTRARIALKELQLAGRPDIPIVLGESLPVNPERPLCWPGHEGRGLDFSEVEDQVSAMRPGLAAEFIARSAMEKPGELVLIPIGPLTNVGRAIQQFPREMAQLKGIVCMGSTFNGFGRENAGGEHNIHLDPEAADIVLRSGIPLVLVGLNVTTRTSLAKAVVDQLAAAGTPLGEFMAHMTYDWFRVLNREVTNMHDPLAVAVSYRSDMVTTVPVRAEVSMDNPGSIAYFEAGQDSPVRICTSVNVDAFHDLFYTRIIGKANQRI